MSTRKFLVALCMLFAYLCASAQEYCMTAPVGYGSSATGGKGKSVSLITSSSQLTTALKNGNGIYIITQNISIDSHISGSGSNYTLMALPGVKLIGTGQSKDKSGILYLKGSNIILRNIIFEGPGAYDCDGWDNLCLDGAQNVWVDHCDFQDGCDGNFDMKGKADNITVTWCRFRYLKKPKSGGSGGAADHRFTDLIGSSSSDKPSDGTFNITFIGAWWDEGCVERMCRTRNSLIHYINCYWNSSVANYYVGPENASAYFEGCTFSRLAPKYIWKSYGGTNSCKFVNCSSATGLPSNSGTVASPSNLGSYSVLSAANAVSAITSSCGSGATLTVTTAGAVSSSCSSGGSPVTTMPTITVTGTPQQSVTAGSAISNIVFTASNATKIEISTLPAGLTSSKSGLTITVSGTPTASGEFTVTATDANGNSDEVTGSVTIKTPQVAPSGDLCVDLTKFAPPTVANGGIPSAWQNIVVNVNNTKSEWANDGFNFGGNADYIDIDVSAYANTTIKSVSFDVTIPNWASTKNTIGYGWTAGTTSSSYTISSAETETVSLTAPSGSKVIHIQRTAGTSTIIGQICLTLNTSGGTTDVAAVLTAPSNTNQSVEQNKSIEAIAITSDITTTFTAPGLPEGVIATTSADGKTLTIAGTPTTVGVYNYSVKATNGTKTSNTISGTITVTQPSGGSSTTTSDWWNFSDADFVALGSNITSNQVVRGLRILANSSYAMAEGTKDNQFTDGTTLSNYIDAKGKGVADSYRAFKFNVTGPCTITVYAQASGNRSVMFNGDKGSSYENTDITTGGYYVLTYNYTGTADSLQIFSKSSGIKFYGIKVTYSSAAAVAPTLSSSSNLSQELTLGSAISDILITSNQDVTFSVTGLPDGVSYTSTATSLTISGTPTAIGNNTIVVTAQNGASLSGSIEATITVNAAPVLPAIAPEVLVSPAAQTITVGDAITPIVFTSDSVATFSVTGIDGTGLTSVVAADSKSVTVSGTPSAEGEIDITVTATA
ncbi:MAG: hypothetical protein J6Y79_00005, partial [Paludibacteraceae bacterium]|nr:hypothetical protein [Paludibacteraceae bacterium]